MITSATESRPEVGGMREIPDVRTVSLAELSDDPAVAEMVDSLIENKTGPEYPLAAAFNSGH